MARELDSILVVDVEATCWEGDAPDGQVNEIIEVGLCILDLETLERSGKRSILVRPERSSVSPFCTELTSLKPEDVADAPSFAEACKALRREHRSRERLWASYGDYDRRQFERQCRERGVGYPFGPSHLNAKTLFALAAGLQREVGMAAALARLGLPLEGRHHRGDDDAWNIAAVLAATLRASRGLLSG